MSDVEKRLFDLLSSGLALLLLSPLLLGIAMAIKLDTRGPVLFRQQRIGRGQKPFRVLKFRTMVDRDPDAIDQHSEQVVSEGEDPRITRVGRFLRATSLDELPQLWNIFRGDMSVVGPRPVLPEQVEVVPRQFMIRFEVRPGLTGLAQVRGRRTLGWLQQLEADAQYILRRGVLYDLWLILRTVHVVATGRGVYGTPGQNWRAYRDSLQQDGDRDDR
ncbi:lipopolysaccharide/colanic/teichoic acid biosynthesis glycosyltransferase [Thioalkalivibrio sp. ALE21]|uniref:sugar transferase n=1 Tax=Thioalkalivibrio sp. ALE21 TaxID=1158175 RepID=UPI000D993866|nr:sugar transferase [Thioalkalivibrio sp. ALE21]PYG00005.1 lipopolysaccharide/colanic/teichoic acid biosynthesis glycosyltransferase [Thioalkalivibrio sp. ALE21]